MASSPLRPAQSLECGSRQFVDYLSPFRSMSNTNPPPAADLPYGPRGWRLVEAGLGRVIAGAGVFGYRATVRENRALSRPLGWSVRAQLVLLRSSGAAKGVVRTRLWKVPDGKVLNGRAFVVAVPTGPALYRYVLDIRDSSGGRIARYSQYLRAVQRRLKVVLVSNKASFWPGEQVRVQVANVGTEPISYGGGVTLRKADGSEVSTLPSAGKRRAVQLSAGAGGACETFELPPDIPAGEYRIERTIVPLFESSRRQIASQISVKSLGV
jgi:hypothetical protein